MYIFWIFTIYYLKIPFLDDPDYDLDSSRVDLRTFYSRHCLVYSIAALSSYSRTIRGFAKSIIARFRKLSEEWKPAKMASVPPAIAAMKQFPERVQVNFCTYPALMLCV